MIARVLLCALAVGGARGGAGGARAARGEHGIALDAHALRARTRAPPRAAPLALGGGGGAAAARGAWDGAPRARAGSRLRQLLRIGGRTRTRPHDRSAHARRASAGGGGGGGGGAELGGGGGGGGPWGAMAVAAPPLSAGGGRKKRILILISDTGGGHRASAQALEAALNELFPGALNIHILDIWTKHGPYPFNTCVKGYQYLAARPLLWWLTWHYSVFYPTRVLTTAWARAAGAGPRFRQCLAEQSPDLVVSMHPLTQEIPVSVLERMAAEKGAARARGEGGDGGAADADGAPGADAALCTGGAARRDGGGAAAAPPPAARRPPSSSPPLLQPLPPLFGGKARRTVPFVTVVTDLGSAHPHWFDKRVDRCFVPSEALRREARRRGLRESQLRLYGLPIRPTFWQPPKARDVTRRALGLRTELQTVLIVGGGDGVGGLREVATHLAAAAASQRAGRVQLVVVCGRNRELRAELAAASWPAGVRVCVLGFVTQMSDYMAAADVLVTKAGPGTIAEACARALPVMLSSYLPGQEAGNVPYVEGQGFGAYRKTPEAIAQGVLRWLSDPDKLAALSANALQAARPLATYQIANEIGGMLFGPSQLMPSGTGQGGQKRHATPTAPLATSLR